jgi:hypothetical protein
VKEAAREPVVPRALVVALAAAACALLALAVWALAARQEQRGGAATLRATHYWAGGYPKSFWDGLDPSRVDTDFARIKAQGFNAVVLAVSWPEFQPRLTPVHAFDEQAFRDLALLVGKAAEHGLRVVLRVGFIWSFRPDAEMPNAERIDAAFHDPDVHRAWLAFVEEVCRRICNAPNFQLAFLSWEDLYPFNLLSAQVRRDEPGFRAALVGWLRERHDLAAVGARYGRAFASWSDVPVPERRSPAYEYVLAWWDDVLAARFFMPARERFPGLSFEERVDWDPVWTKGEHPEWHRHPSVTGRAGAEVATLYYAIAWGMRNASDTTDARGALGQLARLLELTAAHKPRDGLFVDQFNFIDNTPEFSTNTRLAEDQYDAMLAGAAELLTRHRAGYALWLDEDYAANILYNPGFQRGLAGWEPRGTASVAAGRGGGAVLHLAAGASVAQRIVGAGREAGFERGNTGSLCMTGRALASATARVRATGLPAPVALEFGAVAERRCAAIPLSPEFRIEIAALDGVELDRIELYHHVQQSRIRTLEGKPGPQAAALREFNRALAKLAGS